MSLSSSSVSMLKNRLSIGIFTHVSNIVQVGMFTNVNKCLQVGMFTNVYKCLQMFASGNVYKCLQVGMFTQYLFLDLLRMLFEELYELDVISEETFYVWQESKDFPGGKGVALSSVKGFLQWLRKAEEESNEDEVSLKYERCVNIY